MYFAIKLLAHLVTRCFFGRIVVIKPERVPVYGPVVFVGNHNNQFLDAAMLVSNVSRQVRFLAAARSMRRRVIGLLARLSGGIPVNRPEDWKARGAGKIVWNEGRVEVTGIKTNFLTAVKPKGKIVTESGSCLVERVIDDTTLEMCEKIETPCPSAMVGVTYHILPKIDQKEVYGVVAESLQEGGALGIFPEGGSHDRSRLLPFKPGVAIMTFAALLGGCEDIMVVPVGLTYQQADKFQSKAIVHFGEPIVINREFALEYENDKRAATTRVLEALERGLNSVVITAPDHRKMGHINLCCALYPPERQYITDETFYELMKVISNIFWACQDHALMDELDDGLQQYSAHLKEFGIRDNNVWLLNYSAGEASYTLGEKVTKAIFYALVALTVLPLWLPIRLIAWGLAEQHRAQSLAASSVKVTARDVVASYKIIVLMVLVPLFNLAYGVAFGLYTFGASRQSMGTALLAVALLPLAYWVSISAAVRITPLLREIYVLLTVITGKVNIWRDNERALINHRTKMQLLVRDTITTLAQELSPTLLADLHRQFPPVLLAADTKRLLRRKKLWVPVTTQLNYGFQDEIL